MTRAGTVLAVVAGILLTVVPGATPAWAHNQLTAANPPQNATLTTAPTAVTLTFLERLKPGFTTIVVTDAARRRVPAAPATVDGARGTVVLGAPLGNGAHTVAYRVVSVDGHAVQGSYTFTVAHPDRPAAATGPDGPAAAPADAGLTPSWAVVAGPVAGLGLVAAAIILIRARRRRGSRRAGAAG